MVESMWVSTRLLQKELRECSCRIRQQHTDSWMPEVRGQDGGLSKQVLHQMRIARGVSMRYVFRHHCRTSGRTLMAGQSEPMIVSSAVITHLADRHRSPLLVVS